MGDWVKWRFTTNVADTNRWEKKIIKWTLLSQSIKYKLYSVYIHYAQSKINLYLKNKSVIYSLKCTNY